MKSLIKLVLVGSLVAVSANAIKLETYYAKYDQSRAKKANKMIRKDVEWLYAMSKKPINIDKLVIHQSKNPCLLISADYVDMIKVIDKNTISFTKLINGSEGGSVTNFSDAERYDFGNRLVVGVDGSLKDKEEGKVIQVLGDSPSCLSKPTEETWVMYRKINKRYKEVGRMNFSFEVGK